LGNVSSVEIHIVAPRNRRTIGIRKIISITPNDIYMGGMKNDKVLSSCIVVTFQTDKDGVFKINPHYYTYVHTLGEEININEFNKEFDKAVNRINKILP
jgi:hypothetical protein